MNEWAGAIFHHWSDANQCPVYVLGRRFVRVLWDGQLATAWAW